MYYILCVHWRERETLSMRERESEGRERRWRKERDMGSA